LGGVPDPWLRPCSRHQKTFPDGKNQASYIGFAQSCRKKPKKPDYYLLSSQVLLHPKLGF